MALSCPIVTQADKTVAALLKKFNNVNPNSVAYIRDAYEKRTGKQVDLDNVQELYNIVKDEITKDKRERAEKIKQGFIKNLKDLIKFKRTVSSASDRDAMVDLVFREILGVVEKIAEVHPEIPREIIYRGFVDANDIRRYGLPDIFEKAYNKIVSDSKSQAAFNEQYSKGENANQEYLKVLISYEQNYQSLIDNWIPVVTLARKKLGEFENLKLDNSNYFVVDKDNYSFGENNEEDIYNIEESTREAWQEISDAKSSFSSIGKAVRQVLSTIPLETFKNGEVITAKTIFGTTKYMDPLTAHQELTNILYGVNSSEEMMKILEDAVNSDHQFYSGLLNLLKENDQLRTMFFVDMNKNFQPYSMVRVTRENGRTVYKTINSARFNRNTLRAYENTVALASNATDMTIYDKDGNLNYERLEALNNLRNKYFSTINTQNTSINEFIKLTSDNKRKVIVEILDTLGINYTERDIIQLIKGNNAKSLFKNVAKALDAIYKEKPDFANKPKRNFYEIYKNKSVLGSNKQFKGNVQQAVENIVSQVAGITKQYQLESCIRFINSRGNKVTLYSSINPSFMGDLISRIQFFVKNKDTEGMRAFIKEKYLNNHYFYSEGKMYNTWIKEIYDSNLNDENSFANNFEFDKFVGQVDRYNRQEPFENFTGKQHLQTMILKYLEPLEQSNGKSRYRNYPVFILGDANTQKFIKAKKYELNDIIEGFYSIYQQECKRRKQIELLNADMRKRGASELKVREEFCFLPFFNKDFNPNVSYTDENGNTQTKGVGYYYNKLQQDSSPEQIKSYIREYLQDAAEQFRQQCKDMGLYEVSEVKTNGVSSRKSAYFNVNESDLNRIFSDFFYNTKFATIQQLQMMTVDVAFYESSKDLQKRYKEIHAPGTKLDIYARDLFGNYYLHTDKNGHVITHETVKYIDETVVDARDIQEDFAKLVKNVLPESKYAKYIIENGKGGTKITDGQGFRSLDSYRAVMGMAGKWTNRHELAYQEIKSMPLHGLTKEQYQRLDELSVIFQPIKPYMFTHEKYDLTDENGETYGELDIPVQHKYSEMVLIPQLLPNGSMLKDLATYMENNNVDMVCATSCVKVGAFGSTNISNADNAYSLNEALDKAYTHKLDYRDYKIQTNVPAHMDGSQLFGTQLRKIVMSNLKRGFYNEYIGGNKVNLGKGYESVNLSASNLLRFYNQLITANIIDSTKALFNVIDSIDSTSKALIQNAFNSSKTSIDLIESLMTEDEDRFNIALFEGGIEHDTSAFLFSIFKKFINKQTILGGSAVQATSMGIKGHEKSGDLKYVMDYDENGNPINIKYAECEMPFDLSYTDASGNQVKLNFADYCYTDDNRFGELIMDGDQSKLEKEFPGILDRIAYRIPTESAYSILNLKIKRFTPATSGGIIKVPFAGPTISGFDFDIDKLYFFRKSFTERGLGDVDVSKVWKAIYDANPEYYNALKAAQEANPDAHSKLYEYWEDAGLEGSYTDFFNQATSREGADRFTHYDYKKTVQSNSVNDRNNELFNLIWQRMADRETLESRLTPGGFETASEVALKLRILNLGDYNMFMDGDKIDMQKLNNAIQSKYDPEPNYDPSDPMTIVRYNLQNQIASKLIGIMANANTNHAFASNINRFQLKDGFEIKLFGRVGKDLIHNASTSDVLAQLLAASVDAVKDPVLNFLNLTVKTANIGTAMARMGFSLEEIGVFLNQPIIKKVNALAEDKGYSIDRAISETLAEYNVDLSNLKDNGNLSLYDLQNNIVAYRKDNTILDKENNTKFIADQMNVLKTLYNLSVVANGISSFVQATRFTAANSVGSTFGDAYAQKERIEKYITAEESIFDIEVGTDDHSLMPIDLSNKNITDDDYIEYYNQNPFMYEQVMYDAQMQYLKKLAKYFPYETIAYRKVRSTAQSLSKTGVLSANTINSLHNDYLMYTLSMQEGSLFDGGAFLNEHVVNGKSYTNRDYYTKIFPALIKNKANYEELRQNPLIQALEIDINAENIKDSKSLSLKLSNVGAFGRNTQDELRGAWEDLLNKNKELAIDLFLHCFYISGYDFTGTSFMHLAPTALKKAIPVNGVPYDVFLQNMIDNPATMMDDVNFVKMFMLNHDECNEFITSIYKNSEPYKVLEKLRSTNTNIIVIDLNDQAFSKTAGIFAKRNEKTGIYTFSPVLNINGNMYIAIGNESLGKFNVSTTGAMAYQRVNQLQTENSKTYLSPSEGSIFTQKLSPVSSFMDDIKTLLPVEDNNVVSYSEVYNHLKKIYKQTIDQAVAAGQMSTYEASQEMDKLYETFGDGKNVDSLIESANEARAIANETGVYVLNENGEITIMC